MALPMVLLFMKPLRTLVLMLMRVLMVLLFRPKKLLTTLLLLMILMILLLLEGFSLLLPLLGLLSPVALVMLAATMPVLLIPSSLGPLPLLPITLRLIFNVLLLSILLALLVELLSTAAAAIVATLLLPQALLTGVEMMPALPILPAASIPTSELLTPVLPSSLLAAGCGWSKWALASTAENGRAQSATSTPSTAHPIGLVRGEPTRSLKDVRLVSRSLKDVRENLQTAQASDPQKKDLCYPQKPCYAASVLRGNGPPPGMIRHAHTLYM
jgi:hypothetical protein